MNANTVCRATVSVVALLGIAAGIAGCKKPQGPTPVEAAPPHAAPVSNRIDVPESVRRNLGITFAKVERRRVAATIRVPGRFELPPTAMRQYRTVLPARVELLVKQYDRIEPGQVIARLDSPEWRRIQHEAVEAEGEIKTAEAGLEVAIATAAENTRAIELLRQRTATLAEAGAPRAELTAELALAESKAARLAAEIRAARVKVSEANEHFASRLRILASVVDIPKETLLRPAAPATQPASSTTAPATAEVETEEPLWRTITTIEVRAVATGTVESLSVTSGGWADASGLLLTTVDTTQLRFRASAMQADLGRFGRGTTGAILPPRSLATRPNDEIAATVAVSLEANADTRTMELILTPQSPVEWARPGVSAVAEITPASASETELAIPVAAVVQDELQRIYFRRDPANPDKVIRVEGDFGVSDGRWITVLSGVKAGDEVVVDGVYELKLTGSGKTSGAGGHFHADGTWHPDGK